VATDGFRLSKKKIANSSIKEKGSVILPKSVLSELSRLNSENENDVLLEIKTKDKQVVFGMQNVILSSRVIDGEFPNYEKIIPKSSNVVIDVDKEEMIRAVKLASVFAKDAANVVKVTLEKKAIILTAESSQSGRQIAKVDADIKEKGDLVKGFEIAFNYRFLEDLLNSVTGSDVQISFSEPNAPGVFLDPKDKDYLHLIMPVRLQS
jgi:DNA polymerase-3 subunit beta